MAGPRRLPTTNASVRAALSLYRARETIRRATGRAGAAEATLRLAGLAQGRPDLIVGPFRVTVGEAITVEALPGLDVDQLDFLAELDGM